MGRRRKISIVNEEKENDCDDISESASVLTNNNKNNNNLHGPMFTIMSNAQKSEAFHKRYIKEMKQLYARMNHDAFLYTFIKMIKVAMEADENNEYAHTTLIFCAKFVSSYNEDDTHPMLLDTCKWLLSTISYNPHIRLRLCQFVNMILNALGKEAALDDAICDRIMEYMMGQLRDVAPSVRVQAILAMQRLQVPDNPDDPVVRVYQFHLCSDPSPRVRQTVITCIGRNYNTIPYVLERLWDIDERVRRHTYLHMSSYPVRSYKVRQRLMLVEQGLNDRSEAVRKVVTKILLQQWLESYDRNVISLLAALKLDVNEQELDRFRKAGKLMLTEVFKRQPKDELVDLLPKYKESEGEEEAEEKFNRCVPLSALNVEVAFYWQCLAEYLQTEMADELDLILPELSTFCQYVEKFCQMQNSLTDQFEFMNSQFILLSLLEIACNYDLGEEVGRENLHKLLTTLLKNYRLNQRVIRVMFKCIESLMPDSNIRLHYFSEIIQEVCCLNAKQNPLVHDRTLITKLLSHSTDTDLNLKLTSLKVKILDLEEQESVCWQNKNFEQANKYTEEKNAVIEEYTKLLQPCIDKYADAETLGILSKDLKNEIVVKGLQIIFYMVNSEKVNTLNPSASKLYNDFICRHVASNNISARDWALKCGTVFSMLYEPNAKEVFEELYTQFFKNHNIRLWETSINCMIDLLDRYGIQKFAMPEKVKSNKKPLGTGRQLYNAMEHLDMEEEAVENNLSIGQGVDVIYLMSHFLDTCHDVCIVKSIVTGFCRLILRGHIKNSEILEKLLLRYFNPAIDSEINQILGVFLETLLAQRKHHLLEPCLLPTVNAIFSAPFDSPLRDIRPETIMRFIIDSTLPGVCNNSEVIHNRMVRSFLQEMLSNVSNKDLCKVLSKELHSLKPNVALQPNLKEELKEMINRLLESEIEKRTGNYLREFRDKLEGVYRMSAPRTASVVGSDNEDEEAGVAESDTASTTTTGTAAPLELPTVPALEHAAIPPEEQSIVPTDAEVSTTFGRNNIAEHHSLRKSKKAASPEVRETDSPAQPAKIRIEARIDSDTSPTSVQNGSLINNKAEKSLTPTSAKTAVAATRRNTRRQAKDVKESNKNKTPVAKSKAAVSAKQKVATPSKQLTVTPTKQKVATPSRDLTSPVSTRSSRARSTVQKQLNKTLSTPEVIPASPTSPKHQGHSLLYSLRKRINTRSQSATTAVGERTTRQALNKTTNDATLAKSLSTSNSAANSTNSNTPKSHDNTNRIRLPSRRKAEAEADGVAIQQKKRLKQPIVRLQDVQKKLVGNHESPKLRRTPRTLERSMGTNKRTGTPSVDTLRKSTSSVGQEQTNDSKRSRSALEPSARNKQQTAAVVSKIPRLTRSSQAAPNAVKNVRVTLQNMKSRLPITRKNK